MYLDDKKFEESTSMVIDAVRAIMPKAKLLGCHFRVELPGKTTAEHEIDVLLSYKINEKTYNLAIECKNYADKNPIGIEYIRNFSAALDDINEKILEDYDKQEILHGVFVTKSNYRGGAITFGHGKGIRLYKLTSFEGSNYVADYRKKQSLRQLDIFWMRRTFHSIAFEIKNSENNLNINIDKLNEQEQVALLNLEIRLERKIIKIAEIFDSIPQVVAQEITYQKAIKGILALNGNNYTIKRTFINYSVDTIKKTDKRPQAYAEFLENNDLSKSQNFHLSPIHIYEKYISRSKIKKQICFYLINNHDSTEIAAFLNMKKSTLTRHFRELRLTFDLPKRCSTEEIREYLIKSRQYDLIESGV